MAFMLTPWFQQIEAHPRADLFLRILISPLALLAAPASIIILFGMMLSCARDRSPVSTKVLWFLLFFVTACFGAAVYFFAVYRKQFQRETQPALP